MNKDIDPDSTWLSTPTQTLHSVALALLYRGRDYTLTPHDEPFAIGRDEHCDLCIGDEYSSRHHCAIEFRNGKFMLCDDSTNGTYLRLGRAETLRVHRDCAPLTGRGCFKPGRNFSADDADLIHFAIRDAATPR